MGNMYTYDHLRKVFKHPEILCWLCGRDKHTKMHGDWIKYIWNNNNEERVLWAHRASMKSTSITEVGAIYQLLKNPEERIFIVRKTFTEAAENIRSIQAMMMKPEVYELLRLSWFGPKSKEKWDFTVSREGKLTVSAKKRITREGNLQGFGIDSQIVGYHNTSGICDDVVTLADRLSKADRERTKVMMRELRTNIIEKPYAWGFVGPPIS